MGTIPFFSSLDFDITKAAAKLPDVEGPPASLPVPNPSRSFWIDSPGANVFAREGSEGDLTTDADVCIIGAGLTGISAAHHLANLSKDRGVPIKAVVLEARDFCSGATGRNGGQLTPAPFLDFVKRQKLYGTEGAKKAADIENYSVDEMVKIIKAQNAAEAIDYVPSRRILLFLTEQEAEAAQEDFAAAEAAGTNLKDVQWHSKDEMTSNYGIAFAAYSVPGNNLWPLKLVTQLYDLARGLNPDTVSLALHTNTPVTEIAPISSPTSPTGSHYHRRWSLSTPRGSVKCSYVIHATNAYASHLLPHMHGPKGIIPMRGQCMALRAAATLPDKSAWVLNRRYEYWFPRPAKGGEHALAIIGGGRETTGSDEFYTTDDSVVREDVSKLLGDLLPGAFPDKFEKGVKPEMEWTGIMGYTAVDPFVGPVVGPSSSGAGDCVAGYEGQYIAAGYRGHGMPRAYACAEAVVGMIFADMVGTRWTAPEWIPRHFLTTERS